MCVFLGVDLLDFLGEVPKIRGKSTHCGLNTKTGGGWKMNFGEVL